jgi:hypothetical protein
MNNQGNCHRIAGRAMDSRCCATVTLHDPLRRSLGMWLGGREVPSVHFCTLDEGHRGEHLAAAGGGGQGWFRWDESGFRIGARVPQPEWPSDLAASPRLAGPVVESSGAGSESSRNARPMPPPPKGGRHALDATESQELRLPDEALWALAAAVVRLADVIVAASGRTDSGGSTA